MSMTGDQCRLQSLQYIGNLHTILHGMIWNRMDPQQRAFTNAAGTLAQRNSPTTQAYYAELAVEVNNSPMHATAEQSWWWEWWGAESEQGEPFLLAVLPEGVCTPEQVEQMRPAWEQCGFVRLELKHVQR